jgi:hypothetical protein
MDQIAEVLAQAKELAKKYRKLTGKPLGITGEVAEFAAAELLDLQLADARQAGYDATRHVNGKEVKIQIKGRCIPAGAKPGQRLGSIRLDHEWDTVLLVIMDEDYEVLSMYEADRLDIKEALLAPGSKARNERGALAVAKFKSIGREVWPKDDT